MAFRRRYRKSRFNKYRKTRTGVKSRRVRRNNPSRPLVRTTFPDTLMTKIKWSGSKSLPIQTADSPSIYYLRGNGAYDPDSASGGQSCYYWNEMAQLYDYYTVYASKVRVQYMGDANDGDAQVVQYGILPVVVPATLPTSARALGGIPYNKQKFSQLNLSAIPPQLTSYMSTKKIYGISQGKVNDDDQYSGATQSSVPAREWRWAIWAAIPNAGTNITQNAVLIQMDITYYIKFWGRAEQSATPAVPDPDGPTDP